MKRLLASMLALLLAGNALATPTKSNGSTDQLVGDWRGRSLCVDAARAACTDETVVYHVRRHAPGAEAFDIKADKIVDGKPEFMGDLACTLEPTRQLLRCPKDGATWLFRWDGGQWIGTLFGVPGPMRVIRVEKAAP